MSKKKIICFGAGRFAEMYIELLTYLGIEILFVADNDISKWGTELMGIPVKNPREILDYSEPVFISCSCVYHMPIIEQIKRIDEKRIIYDVRDIVLDIARDNVKESTEFETVIFDICSASKWAGTELWSLRLANYLCGKGENTYVLIKNDMQSIGEAITTTLVKIDNRNIVYQMVEFLRGKMPFVLVNNFCEYGLLAAMILKQQYPGRVKIISVLHNDEKDYYTRHFWYDRYIDKYFCVSRRIFDNAKCFGKEKNIDYLTQPIESCSYLSQDKEDGILKIGMASRLEKVQKRIDRLPELLLMLENRKVRYVLEIAGSGSLMPYLSDFIKANDLQDRVFMRGQLDQKQMKDFWKDKDVFLNFSDYEGCSLAMLEAMAYGCVPIVTAVSGVDEVVQDKINGFVCPVGDVEEIAKWIEYAARINLSEMKKSARKAIEKKCNYDNYVKYWINNVLQF